MLNTTDFKRITRRFRKGMGLEEVQALLGPGQRGQSYGYIGEDGKPYQMRICYSWSHASYGRDAANPKENKSVFRGISIVFVDGQVEGKHFVE